MTNIIKGIVSNFHERYESHGGGGRNATLHTEFWLVLKDGSEKKFHFENQKLEVKNKHEISLIFSGEELVGYVNFNSLKYVSLAKDDFINVILVSAAIIFFLLILDKTNIALFVFVVVTLYVVLKNKYFSRSKKYERIISACLNKSN